MAGTGSYMRRPRSKHNGFLANRYLRLVLLMMIVILVASFYVYQRVWVRNLITEIEELEEQNETAGRHLNSLKAEWAAASSIAGIEESIESMQLGLKPTKPSQNLMVQPPADIDGGRYAGMLKALEKLKGSIPIVAPSEAEAQRLFKAE